MILNVDFWKAVEDYREWADYLVKSRVISESEKVEKLSLESFAIWLNTEWPTYAHAKKR